MDTWATRTGTSWPHLLCVCVSNSSVQIELCNTWFCVICWGKGTETPPGRVAVDKRGRRWNSFFYSIQSSDFFGAQWGLHGLDKWLHSFLFAPFCSLFQIWLFFYKRGMKWSVVSTGLSRLDSAYISTLKLPEGEKKNSEMNTVLSCFSYLLEDLCLFQRLHFVQLNQWPLNPCICLTFLHDHYQNVIIVFICTAFEK